MHEFSLADSLLRTVLAVADEHLLRTVSAVRLRIGALSGVSIPALEFAWEYMRQTDARTAAAELEIAAVPGQGGCSSCGFAGAVESSLRICPACGAPGLCFTVGEEFLLTDITGEPAAELPPEASSNG